MSALGYRTILKYRLMIPLFPVDEPCPVCRKVCLDSFGEHAVHCKELPGFKYRHDLVRDVMYDVLKRAEISSRKEAPVNFLTDPLEGRSTLRPADILVFGWAGGKHACVDLTGVSPLVGLRDNGFVAGQAALKAESSKVAKHEKACLENQHVFIPFAFDTFGFLAPEAEEFLNRVLTVLKNSLEELKVLNYSLEVLNVLQSNLESMELQKNSSIHEVGFLCIKKFHIQNVSEAVKYRVHSRADNSQKVNIGSKHSPGPDGEMYYGQLEQILEFSYLLFKTVLFRVKWFDTSNKGRIQNFVIRNNITQIKANGEAFKNDQYILATQVKQCFYLEDMARRPLGWKVVEHVSHKKFSNGGVIVVEDDPDVIHVDNSSDLALSTSLNDLEIAALHIDGQSIDVDAPPDIIDVVDKDDDIIDEEDPIPHDLADSDDEDLVNLDIDDGVNVVYSSEEED
ncbi:putative exostosin-like protein [Tanacetum coccineum]